MTSYEITLIGCGARMGQWEYARTLRRATPILNWYETATRYQKRFAFKNPNDVYVAPMTGAVGAYLNLAYNLYLLAHNAKVQEILIRRLKNKNQFYGAYYETYVAGLLIKAGCEIEFEDESDGKTSHCELTATFPRAGRKFSVEAKMRGPNKKRSMWVTNYLRLLRKELNTTELYSSRQTCPTMEMLKQH